jgi:serine/threonine protein kinase
MTQQMGEEIDLTKIAKLVCKDLDLSLFEKVGKGTYKQTFRVKRGEQPLALKIYQPFIQNGRDVREIDAMRMCDHAHIAKLLSVGNIKYSGTEYIYIIEEYLGGGTLKDRIRNGKKLLTPLETYELGNQLINGISHIQSHNLVHRDLKPENILFRESTDEAVITDFGIVRDLNKDSLTGTWLLQGPGTYYYSSPEQLNNDKEIIDWRTDQFCLGIVLSICAFNDHPFGNPDNVAQHLKPTDKFTLNIQSAGLSALPRMLAAWPAQRYRTPQELITAWISQEIKR